jgi:hypothetical protein
VGLYAEEYDPVEKRMLGNFPQAFSHVALINSALNLMIGEQELRARRKPRRKIVRGQKARKAAKRKSHGAR